MPLRDEGSCGGGGAPRDSAGNLEGWDGEGDGREIQKEGDICIPMADSC